MATIVQTPEFPLGQATAASLWSRWRYAGGKRDVRLDFLRGFAAFAMVVDHISGSRSWLYVITGGDLFYASAAEAFVFISGMVMGIVYRDIIERHGIAAAVSKSLKRAWTLYALTVLLTLSFAAISSLLDLPWALHLTARELPAFVVGTLTLHQTFHLADVLLMYTFLVAGAGPLLALFARGQTRWVLAGSWALWLLWQVSPAQAQIPWTVAGNDVFQLAAWQALFVTAMAIGYHRQAIQGRLKWLSPETVLVGAGVVVLAAAVLYLGRLGSPEGGNTLAALLFGKPDLRVGRLIVFAGAFAFAFAVTTVVWAPLQRLLGWLLLPLGHHALSAYALHIFVVGAFWKLAPLLFGSSRSATQSALLQLVGVAAVWGAIILWPELASIADCCVHCRRNSPISLVRLRCHGHTAIAGNGAPVGWSAGAATPGHAESGAGSGPAACGHPEPHANCP